MRALGVARVSTQEQAQGDRFSIPHQRQRITEYCLARGWELVDVMEYVQSGGSNFRELQTVLATVTRDRVQVVVVNELDRLARDMISTLLFLEDLQKAGCRFVSVSDDLDLTTPDGELKMMILSVFAHYFRRQLSRKIRGGLRERARQGKHHGGRPPYGFRFEGDRLAPHPEQAPVVRQIYSWYVHDGLGGREIAKRLNAEGVPTQTGQSLWAASEIRVLLRRPANAGDLVHGALDFTQERTGVRHKVHRPDPLIVSRAHEGLVSRELWEQAQDLLASRRGSGRRADSPYLLSGLVYCGLCGRTMVPVKGRTAPRYVCRGYQASGTCSSGHSQPVPAVEAAVMDNLFAKLDVPGADDLERWVRQRIAQDEGSRQTARERERIARALATVPAMRQRAEDALLQGALTISRFRAVQAKIEAEESRLRFALAALDKVPPPATQTGAVLRAELEETVRGLREVGTLHERREMIRRYVTWVELLPNEIRVHYDPRPAPRSASHADAGPALAPEPPTPPG